MALRKGGSVVSSGGVLGICWWCLQQFCELCHVGQIQSCDLGLGGNSDMSFGLVRYRMQRRQVDCRCPWSLRCPLDRRVVCVGASNDGSL